MLRCPSPAALRGGLWARCGDRHCRDPLQHQQRPEISDLRGRQLRGRGVDGRAESHCAGRKCRCLPQARWFDRRSRIAMQFNTNKIAVLLTVMALAISSAAQADWQVQQGRKAFALSPSETGMTATVSVKAPARGTIARRLAVAFRRRSLSTGEGVEVIGINPGDGPLTQSPIEVVTSVQRSAAHSAFDEDGDRRAIR